MRIKFFILILALALSACGDSHLRGSTKNSDDGKTYLRFVQSNGCAQMTVDGKIWRHGLGEVGEIEAGMHTVDCNGQIQFVIPKGVVFSFDYWGP